MSTTLSSAGSGIDRKSLKKPDGFMTSVANAFQKVASHTYVMGLALGGLFVIGLLVAFYFNKMEVKSSAARNQLYLAEKAFETELKALAPAKPAAPNAKEKAPENAKGAQPDLESVAYKKLDVDQAFPQAIAKFKAIDEEFTRTRGATEARFKLGSLYFDHGDYSKALPWFEKAADHASGFDKAVALLSVGYSFENLGKYQDAIQSFQKAMKLGESSLKGDILLGIARCYEALHDVANARSTYDKILADLANTEFAKTAELYKSRLE